MLIRAGYELTYDCPQPVPAVFLLNLHPSRRRDIVSEQPLGFSQPAPSSDYLDGFGNLCTRTVLPAGRTTISSRFVLRDSGLPDEIAPEAVQHEVADLPDAVLVYLLASRYCDTEFLGNVAWQQFGTTKPGWDRLQAICDFVHDHIRFDYQRADATRTAYGAYSGGVGVCRDYAHLAIALCRCMNIPARYCTGYLGDIGVPPVPDPMDFSGWFQAYLGGRWLTMDARHNMPRIGRILIGTGRDAADVAISTTFGPTFLSGFQVVTDEVDEGEAALIAA